MTLFIKKIISLGYDDAVRRYWLYDDMFFAKGGRVYIPISELRQMFLKEALDLLYVGYSGIERSRSLLTRLFFWSSMEDDIEVYV